ncbi:DUF4129 domain-containing protein [Acidimicrobiaceae bacterium AH-315-P05]|nr:DUF4129 domain-containing protein [Acidimicrobiaceae bacterium AH-315-P05]
MRSLWSRLTSLPITTKTAIRRVATVVVLVVLLGAVMIGSRWDGELNHQVENTPSSIPPGVGSISLLEVIFGGAIAVLALVLALGLALTSKRAVLSALGIVAILVMIVSVMSGDVVGPLLESSDSGIGEAARDKLVTVGNIPGPVGVVALFVVLLAGFLVWRYARRQSEEAPTEVALSDSIVSIATELEATGNDDRSAIIATYSQLEVLLANAGHERFDFETAAEHLGRVLERLGAAGDDVVVLLDIYQRAAYGSKTPGVANLLGTLRSHAADTLQRIAAQISGRSFGVIEGVGAGQNG